MIKTNIKLQKYRSFHTPVETKQPCSHLVRFLKYASYVIESATFSTIGENRSPFVNIKLLFKFAFSYLLNKK